MKTVSFLSGVTAMALSTFACGDDGGKSESLTCGEGTYEAMGECISYDPNDSEPPQTSIEPGVTRFRASEIDVRLVTEPGARIFYTTDGSEPSDSSENEAEDVLLPRVALNPGTTLKFYAVDAAGNQEDTQTVVLEQDLDGPGLVSGLTATEESDGSVSLSWNNPSDEDFGGVVILREGKSTALVSGQVVDAADVVYVGDGSTASDMPGLGSFTYRAVSFDSLYNYGAFIAVDFSNIVALSDSTGWVFNSDGTFTEGTSPDGATYTASFVSGSSGSIEFEITVANSSGTTLHAPKLFFPNISGATISGDLEIDGAGYTRFGENGVSLAHGESLSSTVRFSFDQGVTSLSTDLSLVSNPLIVAGGRSNQALLSVADLAAEEEIGVMAADEFASVNNNNGNTGVRGFATRKGSRFIWAGNRSSGKVRKIDTATWTTVAVGEIGEDQNLVGQPLFGPGGLLWVSLYVGGPGYLGSQRRNGERNSFLVALDPEQMTEVRRLPLEDRIPRSVQWSSELNSFVVAYHRGTAISIVDPSVDGASALRTIKNDDITASRCLALSPDGDKAYVATHSSSFHRETTFSMSAINLIDGSVEKNADVFTGPIVACVTDGSGTLWVGNNGNFGLNRVDPEVEFAIENIHNRNVQGLFSAGESIYVWGEMIGGGTAVLEHSAADGSVVRSAELSNSSSGHGIALVE